MSRLEKRNLRNGLLFCAPWIFGFLALQIYPIFYSFYLSTTDYSGFGKAVSIGMANFKELVSDPMVRQSAYNTLYYTAFAVPVGIVVAIGLALAMNQKVKEVSVYRAILYLPSILPAFALVYVWLLFTNPAYGLLSRIFLALHLPQIDWIGDRHFTKPSVVILAQYGAGNAALIFLASLRSIPRDLYESAEIDGAGVFRRFFTITIPMITPIILYNIIWGLSAGLQAFTQAYLMASGGYGLVGPSNSLMFYVVYIYKTAFQYSRMGYAAALALFLFLGSVLLAVGVFKWGRSWVHYESE
ncbi:carbohydrate ABC transporter permease [Leadbettera azotonutricia]|uniref:Sugar ABC transporter permease n=1 Tax=Leadbettera azotonutricia (strain ATCC BAA-888 / DSM 13862 / ZAS-9) TaxID=545695 RepID=F5YA36_LEAAZ|nr:sugar ABC transporter permease [Leadbettera azotonutricia]AEF80875.1 sugar ABC transporter permease [Leadbettera azotonutricia ZAS-9]